MREHPLLLKEEPYIMAPDIDLTNNIAATKIDKERDRCEECGKALGFPYYLLVGIPPSHSLVTVCKCNNLDDERHELEALMGVVRLAGRDFNIDDKHQWIFSDQNLRNSKTRICIDCHEEYERYIQYAESGELSFIHIRRVYFAVEENQRRRTPIHSAMSDYERYIISLPDRGSIHYVGTGINYGQWSHWDVEYEGHMDRIAECLRSALIPDYDKSNYVLNGDYVNSIKQELRADFIQDKNRAVPNDQELTGWMKKHYTSNESSYFWVKARILQSIYKSKKLQDGK